jgi:hypothetical protein
MMSNRQIHLGSGLQIVKLTDAIIQVRDGEESISPSLVCNNPAYDDAWVRLSRRGANDSPELGTCWDLTAGYSGSTPPDQLIGELIRTIPKSRVIGWKAAIYFQVQIPLPAAPELIAHLIIHIITLVQHAEPFSTDVIIEHQSHT